MISKNILFRSVLGWSELKTPLSHNEFFQFIIEYRRFVLYFSLTILLLLDTLSCKNFVSLVELDVIYTVSPSCLFKIYVQAKSKGFQIPHGIRRTFFLSRFHINCFQSLCQLFLFLRFCQFFLFHVICKQLLCHLCRLFVFCESLSSTIFSMSCSV